MDSASKIIAYHYWKDRTSHHARRNTQPNRLLWWNCNQNVFRRISRRWCSSPALQVSSWPVVRADKSKKKKIKAFAWKHFASAPLIYWSFVQWSSNIHLLEFWLALILLHLLLQTWKRTDPPDATTFLQMLRMSKSTRHIPQFYLSHL